jgi:hypothetical protein
MLTVHRPTTVLHIIIFDIRKTSRTNCTSHGHPFGTPPPCMNIEEPKYYRTVLNTNQQHRTLLDPS